MLICGISKIQYRFHVTDLYTKKFDPNIRKHFLSWYIIILDLCPYQNVKQYRILKGLEKTWKVLFTRNITWFVLENKREYITLCLLNNDIHTANIRRIYREKECTLLPPLPQRPATLGNVPLGCTVLEYCHAGTRLSYRFLRPLEEHRKSKTSIEKSYND